MLMIVRYLRNISLMFIVFCSILYAQKDSLDTIELRSDKIYQGKVIKVTTTTIEFKEALTNLNYEFEKDDIKFVKLADGTTLTFNERAQLVGGDNSKQAQSEPPKPETAAQADKKDDSSMSRLIIITAGAVVGVLLLASLIF